MNFNKREVFFKNWMEQGVWSIKHLINDKGSMLDFAEFRRNYNLQPCSSREYPVVVRVIPQALIVQSKSPYYTQ